MAEPLRVLVVDDDFRVAATHAAALGRIPSCRVVGRATTLAEARGILTERAVDLVLADEYLPDGSGTDLVGMADAGVILVTAADSWDKVRRAVLKGAVGYIVKPFPMPLLVQRVTEFARFYEAVSVDRPVAQVEIDEVLSMLRVKARGRLPKGRSPVTATAVADLLRNSERPTTAMEVAATLGISRATAQRYLADLVEDNAVSLSLRYGTHGRPEHSYAWLR